MYEAILLSRFATAWVRNPESKERKKKPFRFHHSMSNLISPTKTCSTSLLSTNCQMYEAMLLSRFATAWVRNPESKERKKKPSDFITPCRTWFLPPRLVPPLCFPRFVRCMRQCFSVGLPPRGCEILSLKKERKTFRFHHSMSNLISPTKTCSTTLLSTNCQMYEAMLRGFPKHALLFEFLWCLCVEF